MSNKKPKIAWQKYEDLIEKQLSSPILGNIMKNIVRNKSLEDLQEETEEDDIDENYDTFDTNVQDNIPSVLPISEKVIEDIMMLSNFDCWMAHTNFDITPRIKDILNQIPGVEILKIFSRYRFFIGVGTLFDFKDVRKIIEREIIQEK
jgi:hypothetical protein